MPRPKTAGADLMGSQDLGAECPGAILLGSGEEGVRGVHVSQGCPLRLLWRSLFWSRHSRGGMPYRFLNAREKCSWLG